jgi:hypothetical protein
VKIRHSHLLAALFIFVGTTSYADVGNDRPSFFDRVTTVPSNIDRFGLFYVVEHDGDGEGEELPPSVNYYPKDSMDREPSMAVTNLELCRRPQEKKTCSAFQKVVDGQTLTLGDDMTESRIAGAGYATDFIAKVSVDARLHDLAATGVPGSRNRALELTPSKIDPNAGKAPHDENYEEFWYRDGDQYRQHDWREGHAGCHIGGTMVPSQQRPDFSPFYVEFDEFLGGYNFGGGNAQLDFRDMKFDWACG